MNPMGQRQNGSWTLRSGGHRYQNLFSGDCPTKKKARLAGWTAACLSLMGASIGLDYLATRPARSHPEVYQTSQQMVSPIKQSWREIAKVSGRLSPQTKAEMARLYFAKVAHLLMADAPHDTFCLKQMPFDAPLSDSEQAEACRLFDQMDNKDGKDSNVEAFSLLQQWIDGVMVYHAPWHICDKAKGEVDAQWGKYIDARRQAQSNEDYLMRVNDQQENANFQWLATVVSLLNLPVGMRAGFLAEDALRERRAKKAAQSRENQPDTVQ